MARFDFVVLGGGNSGLTAAHLVATSGRQVAVIDPSPIGGLCNLGGCKPKKILVRATEVLEMVRHAGEHGIELDAVPIDWARVIERKRALTGAVSAEATATLAEAGIALLSGSPAFRSRSSLMVEGQDVAFGAALVATGSSPRRLTFPGAEHTITTDGFLNLRTPPARMVVIGAGDSAFEFGQVAARLGAEVHLLHPGARALAGQDAEMVDALVAFSRTLGIRVWDHPRVHRVTANDGTFLIDADTPDGVRSFQAEVVLNASGRLPNLEGLHLERAGVQAGERGVQVDPFLRSPTNRAVFAAGDAHDGYPSKLCTMACLEGHVAARNYLEGDVEPMNYSGVPQAVSTVPPLASVGLTEAEARKPGRDVQVIRAELAQLEVYRVEAELVGRVKLLVDAQTQQVLGAHLYGAEAGENIHLFAMAVRLGLTRGQLGQLAFACPTRASGLLCMLADYRGQGLIPH